LAVEGATAQAITEVMLLEAWNRLRQRKLDKPDPMAPWHWLGPRTGWLLLKILVNKLKLPVYGWMQWTVSGAHTTRQELNVPQARTPRSFHLRTTRTKKELRLTYRPQFSSDLGFP